MDLQKDSDKMEDTVRFKHKSGFMCFSLKHAAHCTKCYIKVKIMEANLTIGTHLKRTVVVPQG